MNKWSMQTIEKIQMLFNREGINVNVMIVFDEITNIPKEYRASYKINDDLKYFESWCVNSIISEEEVMSSIMIIKSKIRDQKLNELLK